MVLWSVIDDEGAYELAACEPCAERLAEAGAIVTRV